jgi:hypothetical protein
MPVGCLWSLSRKYFKTKVFCCHFYSSSLSFPRGSFITSVITFLASYRTTKLSLFILHPQVRNNCSASTVCRISLSSFHNSLPTSQEPLNDFIMLATRYFLYTLFSTLLLVQGGLIASSSPRQKGGGGLITSHAPPAKESKFTSLDYNFHISAYRISHKSPF